MDIFTDHEALRIRQRERSLIEFQELCSDTLREWPGQETIIEGARLCLRQLTDMKDGADATEGFEGLSLAAEACGKACADLLPGKAQMFRIYAAVFGAVAETSSGGVR